MGARGRFTGGERHALGREGLLAPGAAHPRARSHRGLAPWHGRPMAARVDLRLAAIALLAAFFSGWFTGHVARCPPTAVVLDCAGHAGDAAYAQANRRENRRLSAGVVPQGEGAQSAGGPGNEHLRGQLEGIKVRARTCAGPWTMPVGPARLRRQRVACCVAASCSGSPPPPLLNCCAHVWRMHVRVDMCMCMCVRGSARMMVVWGRERSASRMRAPAYMCACMHVRCHRHAVRATRDSTARAMKPTRVCFAHGAHPRACYTCRCRRSCGGCTRTRTRRCAKRAPRCRTSRRRRKPHA